MAVSSGVVSVVIHLTVILKLRQSTAQTLRSQFKDWIPILQDLP